MQIQVRMAVCKQTDYKAMNTDLFFSFEQCRAVEIGSAIETFASVFRFAMEYSKGGR